MYYIHRHLCLPQRPWGGDVLRDVREGQAEEPARGFFAPDRDEDRRPRPGGRVTPARLVLRIAVCIGALVALDVAIAPSFAPPETYMTAYRLPRTAPTASIADYANAIDLAARAPQHRPIAAFLGASPTYGQRISDARSTFPAAFAAASEASGTPFQAFNLATNGQLVGDYLVLARRFSRDADVVFVQLTYHTFSPTQGRLRIRYPELPAVLGVPLSDAEGKLLGLPARTGSLGMPGVASSIDAPLGRWWTLWRERDVIDRRLFGGPPRQTLPAMLEPATTTSTAEATFTVLPDDAANDGSASFDSLDPGARMTAIALYAEDSSFTVSASDDQVRLLDELAGTLASEHKKAVFFISPMNFDVIDSYGLIDPAQYASNIGELRAVVGSHGLRFIDLNTEAESVPVADFADISHTNDAGGALVGRLLWDLTASYVATVTP
jgi:hypothetical protein